MDDLDLLRRFEPIVRYTKGELFFPAGVDEYVNRASLWLRTPDNQDRLLVPAGELNLDVLAQHDEAPVDHVLYMNLVQEPMPSLAYQRWRNRPDREVFHSAGRLARVPLLFRIVDSLFDVTFLVRGQVPGGFTAAAQVRYEEMHRRDPRRVYYGRVVRDRRWIVLQYLFFFTMNDWRSTFYGVNDHETDWEQVFVYAYETGDGSLEPRWVAYASHDFKGDDLRRRWDDPLLDKVGTHPVVYAGAGSHASYFEHGEYLVGIEPAFLKPVEYYAQRLRRFWYEQLGMGRHDQPAMNRRDRPLLNIPHIDYARGDGKSIGPGQPEAWSPVVISDDVPWVDKYRGLWGLDTRDFIGGERAPSGPKYNRDGSVRQSWYDPLGWAGMDKVPPPPEVKSAFEARIAELEQRRQDLDEQIAAERAGIAKLELDLIALRTSEYGGGIAKATEPAADAGRKTLDGLQQERVVISETIRALQATLARHVAGEELSATAHIRSIHHPEPPLPANRFFVDVWAAISGGLTLLALVVLFFLQPPFWLALILVVLMAFGAIEAAARSRLTNYLLTTVIIMALIAVAILFIEFWQAILILSVAALVIFMTVDNLRELTHR